MIIKRAIKLEELEKNVQNFLLDNTVRILPIKLKNEVVKAKRERKIRYRAIDLSYDIFRQGLSLAKQISK